MEQKRAFESTPQAGDWKQGGIAPLASVPSSGGNIPAQNLSLLTAAVPHDVPRLIADIDIRHNVAVHVSLVTDEGIFGAAGHSFSYAPAMNPTVVQHSAASFAARPSGRAAPAVGSSAPAVAGCLASRS
uniref:Uncharacterized protein n=1 Tax=Mycena chlorophos TaxID=658473 RepID=A0ABQ0LAW1_MYCCL|nr:predicted protein [Mycena chlorophos]